MYFVLFYLYYSIPIEPYLLKISTCKKTVNKNYLSVAKINRVYSILLLG